MSLNLDLIKGINAKVNTFCDATQCADCPAFHFNDCEALFKQLGNFVRRWQLDFDTIAYNKGDFWNVQALIEYVEEGLQCNGDCENCDNMALCKEIDNFAVEAYLHLKNISNTLDKG